MTDEIPVFTAHDIPDLINSLPVQFGFTPQDSIVAVATFGPRNRFGVRMRMDVPPLDLADAVADRIVAHLVQHGAEGAVILAVTPHTAEAELLVRAIHERLGPIRTVVAAWADGQRYWSLDGPAEGEPYDATDHHVSVLQAVVAGQVIVPDRAALAARFDPVAGERRRWLGLAAASVRDQVMSIVHAHPGEDVADLATDDVGDVLARALAGDGPDDGGSLRLAVWVSSVPFRDRVWQAMSRDDADHQVRVWTHVARVAPVELAPAPLCLAGFAAWLTGDGTLARIAAERATSIDPDYRMASLLLGVLDAGVPPSAWSSFGAGDRRSA